MGRCSPILEYAPDALVVITVMGASTSFLAATTGILQNDLKRVIAYSTCSQLGYMVFACGISNYSVGIFHLMNHAFFKALLFLSAGSIIHALADEQDMRKMGGCVQLLPYTYGMVLIGSMSLTGFPFLTGFYSKDVILELAYAKYTVSGNFAYWLGSLSVFFTSYYSFRLIYMAFIGPVNTYKSSVKQIHDAGPLLGIPLIPLALGSIFIGFLGKDMMIGSGTHFWGNALFTLPQNSIFIESEYIPQEVKYLPLVLTLLGAVVAYLINISESFILNISYPFITSDFGRVFYSFFNKRWLFDKVYNDFIAKPFMRFGYEVSFKALDKGAIEILGPYGISKSIQEIVLKASRLQSGLIYHYALIMLIGLTFLIYVSSSSCDIRLYVIYLITFLFFNSFLDEA